MLSSPRTRIEEVAFRKGWVMVLCVVFSFSSLIGTLVLRSRISNSRTTDFCSELNLLNAAVQNVVIGQIPTATNLEKILYYKQHPSEIQTRIARETAKSIPELQILVKAECGGPLPNEKLQALIRSLVK